MSPPPALQRRSHLFFDLDGTLTDPREGIVRCLRHAFDGVRVAVPADDELVSCIGPPLQASLLRLLGTDNEHLASEALALYRQRYKSLGMFENAVYPGILDALSTLAERGFTLWVVTSKPSVFARKIVEHFALTHHFTGIHGSELSGERCDKAELIAHVLSSEGIASADALMIGDRSHDVLGARANGVRCAGVLWGYGSRTELEAAGADRVYDSVAELVTELSSRAPAPAL